MSEPAAHLTHQDVTIDLHEGDERAIGRSRGCDLRVGAEPAEDLGVSRTAATVSLRDGRVWVRNDSTSQPVYLVPEVGPTRMLERKDEIARRVVEAINEVTQIPQESIWVVFEDVSRDDWYVGPTRVSQLQKK